MTDREKVIKALELCSAKYECCKESPDIRCPYDKFLGTCDDLCDECTTMLAKDALAMLNEQEPKEAEFEGGGSSWWYVCGECHGIIDQKDRYCRHCGREIRWM